MTVLLSRFWPPNQDIIEHVKVFKGILFDYYGLETPFPKNLVEFFTFVFNCSFQFVFLVVWKFPDKDRSHWFFNEQKMSLFFI